MEDLKLDSAGHQSFGGCHDPRVLFNQSIDRFINHSLSLTHIVSYEKHSQKQTCKELRGVGVVSTPWLSFQGQLSKMIGRTQRVPQYFITYLLATQQNVQIKVSWQTTITAAPCSPLLSDPTLFHGRPSPHLSDAFILWGASYHIGGGQVREVAGGNRIACKRWAETQDGVEDRRAGQKKVRPREKFLKHLLARQLRSSYSWNIKYQGTNGGRQSSCAGMAHHTKKRSQGHRAFWVSSLEQVLY